MFRIVFDRSLITNKLQITLTKLDKLNQHKNIIGGDHYNIDSYR
jgi:hypothetical protein